MKIFDINLWKFGQVDDEFVGTISNYLENFENISYSEIVPVAYSSIDDLKAGLVSGEVDLALTKLG